jgi:hypothetical protein
MAQSEHASGDSGAVRITPEALAALDKRRPPQRHRVAPVRRLAASDRVCSLWRAIADGKTIGLFASEHEASKALCSAVPHLYGVFKFRDGFRALFAGQLLVCVDNEAEARQRLDEEYAESRRVWIEGMRRLWGDGSVGDGE